MTDAEQHAAEVHDRLWNPTNAVVDDGIDLKRPKKVATTEPEICCDQCEQPVEKADIPEIPELPKTEISVEKPMPLLTIHRIIRVVGARFNVTPDEILSETRFARVVTPRHVAMYLAKTLTTQSRVQIGRLMGGRDHTTVINALKRMEYRLEHDEGFRSLIADLMSELTCRPSTPQTSNS